MSGTMDKRVTFTLPSDMEQELRDSAWANRQNVSEWLRDAIEAKLQLEKLTKKR